MEVAMQPQQDPSSKTFYRGAARPGSLRYRAVAEATHLHVARRLAGLSREPIRP
jgi:hypothetical protein